MVFVPFFNQEVVWELFDEENPDVCDRPWFIIVWRRRLPNLVVRKWLKFAKCDVCIGFREARERTRCVATLTEIKIQEARHIRFVKAERSSYYLRLHRAIKLYPWYMSIIVDGADQQSYRFPYFHWQSHETQAAAGYRVQVHLTGVLVHGVGTFAYTTYDNVKQGTNVTIERLVRTLCTLFKAGHKIPDTLYLQLDNTSKQNKSRYLFAYLGWMILSGVFKRIVVSFLPVGHTHEDIDQFFSRLAVYLRGNNALSRHGLALALRACYTKSWTFNCSPRVEHLDTVSNMSEYFVPEFMHETKMEGHSQFHQFEVTEHMVPKPKSDDAKSDPPRDVPKPGASPAKPAKHAVPILRVKKWCGVVGESWSGLSEHSHYEQLFHTLPPKLLGDVPDAQRKDSPSDDFYRKQVEALAKLSKSREIPVRHSADTLKVVSAIHDPAPLPFTTEARNIFNLGGLMAPDVNQGAGVDPDASDLKVADADMDPTTDESDVDTEFKVGDVVLCRPCDRKDADDENEEAEVSFWIGKIKKFFTRARCQIHWYKGKMHRKRLQYTPHMLTTWVENKRKGKRSKWKYTTEPNVTTVPLASVQVTCCFFFSAIQNV